MQQLTVSPERLLERSAECGTKAEEMQTTIDNMSTIMNELATEWLGEASQSFQDQYQELLPSFNSMHELIVQLSGQLSQIAANYEEFEKTTASSLGVK